MLQIYDNLTTDRLAHNNKDKMTKLQAYEAAHNLEIKAFEAAIPASLEQPKNNINKVQNIITLVYPRPQK